MLIVKKVVVNDNSGTKVASDFSFQVNGGAAQAFEADGQNDLTVDPGTYNVTEPAVAKLRDDVRRLLERGARARRDEDLHDHQQRPAGDADRQEGRRERQWRHQGRTSDFSFR